MNYKIVSSDLDGTLLNNQMEVSDENRFAVKQYTDLGGVFVPNSGRSLGEMPRAVKDMPGVRFLICSDGADIYDKATDTRISLTMTKEEKDRVLAILGDYENFVTVHYQGNSYLDAARYDEATMRYNNVNDYFRIHFEETNFPTENFADFCVSLADAEMICAFSTAARSWRPAALGWRPQGLWWRRPIPIISRSLRLAQARETPFCAWLSTLAWLVRRPSPWATASTTFL